MLALVVVAFSVPILAGAQEQGLVTCNGPDCNWQALIGMVDSIITWLVGFLAIIAVIVLVITGFQLVTSGGNSEAASAAKTRFTNVVVGFIIVLAAWLIVDTLLATLTPCGGLNQWLNPGACAGQ